MLHRHLTHEQVGAGLGAALRSGALTADAVALEARRINDDPPGPDAGAQRDVETLEPARDAMPAVRSLTERRLQTGLPDDTRPPPTVDKYDQLLSRTQANPTEGAGP